MRLLLVMILVELDISLVVVVLEEVMTQAQKVMVESGVVLMEEIKILLSNRWHYLIQEGVEEEPVLISGLLLE